MRIRQAVGGTHAGKVRDTNEDAVLRLKEVPLYAIADGMGGPGCGDLASKIALDILASHAAEIQGANIAVRDDRSTANRLALGRLLDEIFGHANRMIQAEAVKRSRVEMGSTLVMASVVGCYCYIAHVGDSRAYLFRDGVLHRLTEDHTVAELRYRRGRMSAEDYETSAERHVLYQALGAGVDVDVDLAEVRLAGGDVLLLCSDGLTRAVPDDDICGRIEPTDLASTLRSLLGRAMECGAPDNVTAVLLGVEAEEGDDSFAAVTEVLRGVFLFSDMTDQELLIVAPYLEEVVVDKGHTIVSEGDPGDTFYVVISGRVRVSRGQMRLQDVGGGGHFGELSLTRSSERAATVRALTPVRLFSLTRTRFHELVRQKPELGARLAMSLLGAVGDRLREMTDRLEKTEKAARGDLR